MRKIPPFFYIPAVFLLFIFSSCKEDKKDIVRYDVDETKLQDFGEEFQSSETSKDISQYNYEYVAAEPGNYQSHYDVVGSDLKGNDVTGYIDVEGKIGKGTLEDEMGNEIEVEVVEWVDKGELKAVDQEGNVWELIVE